MDKMKRSYALIAIALLIIVGCSKFGTNVFRTEQTLTQVAYTAYTGYTNALLSGTLKISADQSNSVRTARLQFAASISTLESWRLAYETNSAVKPQVQAALDAATANSANFVALLHLFITP